MTSKSPIKTKEWKQSVHIQKIGSGLIVYSYAEKESNSGMRKNSRILLMNTINGMIGYYNDDKLPDIPIKNIQNIKQFKKKASIATTTVLKLRKKPSIELRVADVDEKGKKITQKWLFVFKNQKMANDWIRQILAVKVKQSQRPIKSYIVSYNQKNKNKNTNININKVERQSIILQNPQVNLNTSQSKLIDINKSNNLPQKLQPLDSHLMIGEQNNTINTLYQYPPTNNPFINSSLTIKNQDYQNMKSISKVHPNNSVINNISMKSNPVPVINSKSDIGMVSSKQFPRITIIQSQVNKNYQNQSPVQAQNKTNRIQNSRYSQKPLVPMATVQNKLSSIKKLQQSNISSNRIYENNINQIDWNLEFINSNNPINVIMKFRQKAQAAVINIIDDLGTLEAKRKYIPFQKQPFQKYNIGTLVVSLCFLTLDQIEYKSLKNEFRNYDYIINATQNKHFIRVPLSAIINYKGITSLVKARLPKTQLISYANIYRELQDLERITKIDKSIFQTNGTFYRFITPKITYIFIDQLTNFIPFDLQASQHGCQLRKQFMQAEKYILPCAQIIGDKSRRNLTGFRELQEASNRMRDYAFDVLRYIQSMNLSILNTTQLTKQFHFNGVSLRCLGLCYERCENKSIKKYLISQITSRICKKVMKSQLQQQIKKMQISQSRISTSQPKNIILIDIAFNLLNDIVSQNDRSNRIWKVVQHQVKRKFNLSFSKQDLSIGYFLSSLFSKCGLIFNYKYLNKSNNFFRSPNTLRRQFVVGFKTQIDTFKITFTSQFKKINSILNDDPHQQGFHQLLQILQMKQRGLPNFCYVYNLQQRIKWYLGNFIPYDSLNYKQLNIYNSIGQQPPTVNSIKQSLLAMKWLTKNSNDLKVNTIFEISTDLINFWGGQNHPLLSDLFDFMSEMNIINGFFQKAISFTKSSLQNCQKSSKFNNLICAQKYYQLGEIYFKMGKKQDSLTNYQITRQILLSNKKTNLQQFGSLSLKLAVLNLNFSKIQQAIARALQALKIFQTPPIQEQYILETYELLSRAYQISNKKGQLLNLSLQSSKILSTLSNIHVYQRMLKISLFPHLINTSCEAAKQILIIYQKMPKYSNQQQCLEFLKNQTLEHSDIHFQNKLQKINRILLQINNKNLRTKYRGISSANQGQAEQFLAYLEAIGTVLGDNFIIGTLTEATQ